MAGGAVVADATLRAVAIDAGLDRGEIEIARQFAFHDIVAIEAGEAFLMEGVIKFPQRHPAGRHTDFSDQWSSVGGFGGFHFMANGTAREGGALAIGELGAFVREENHVLEVFTGFVLSLDAAAFFFNVADEIIAASDALDIATEFLVLNVEAAEKGADVVGIAMRQGEAGSFFIELEGVALGAMLRVGDRELILAAGILFVAIGTL